MGQNDRQTELQYHDVSTYLRAWYKGKKNDSPIELGSDLGFNATRDQGQASIYPLSLGGWGRRAKAYNMQAPGLPLLLGGAGPMGMYGIHYLTYEEIYMQP